MSRKPRNLYDDDSGLDQRELFWAAGFFEATGAAYAVSRSKHGRADLYTSIEWCDRGTLERFRLAVGRLGIINRNAYSTKHSTRGSSAPSAAAKIWRWQISTATMTIAMWRRIWPMLSIRRRAQVQMSWDAYRLSRRKDPQPFEEEVRRVNPEYPRSGTASPSSGIPGGGTETSSETRHAPNSATPMPATSPGVTWQRPGEGGARE